MERLRRSLRGSDRSAPEEKKCAINFITVTRERSNRDDSPFNIGSFNATYYSCSCIPLAAEDAGCRDYQSRARYAWILPEPGPYHLRHALNPAILCCA